MLKLKMKYLTITVMMMVVGCATNNQPEFKPLAPEQLQDLLYKENVNLARKSVTEKDYKDNDDEC